MDGNLGGRIRLVHIIKTAEVDAADVKTADAHRCIREGIKFNRRAGLNAVRIPMILIEANHNGRSKECAVRDRSATGERVRKWISRIVWISAIFDQSLKPKTGDRWGAGEGEEFCLCIETVLERAVGILPIVELSDVACAAARRLLAGKKRRRNNSMEQAKASTNNKISLRAEIICNAQPRITGLPLSIELSA